MPNRSRPWSLTLIATLFGCGSETSPPAPAELPYSPHTAGAECAACHPNHVEEWRISPHAYAMNDPVFHAMVRLGQAETSGELDQFCTKCHSPLGVERGETAISFDTENGVFQQATEGLSAAAMSGVSCEVCHSITSAESRFNAHFTMARDGVRRGPIQDPIPSTAHRTEFSALHSDSDVCGSCHNVVNERFTRVVAIEQTMTEWVQSGFNGAKDCQDCHMPEYSGRAAPGGPERSLHRHFFVGVDVPLISDFPGFDRLRELTGELLRESARLEVQALPTERRLALRIENLAGHALPSGATADRELWVEVLVRDSNGALAFESGTPDERGDLRVDDAERTTRPGSDPQLVLYTQRMYFDPSLEAPKAPGTRRTVDFLWQPNDEVTSTIRPGATDARNYDLAALEAGSYTAEIRLLFRSFPPHLLHRLEREAGLDPAVAPLVPTMELATSHVEFALP